MTTPFWRPPEPSEARDRVLDAVLAHAPFDGWSDKALVAAAADLGIEPDEARRAFPGGALDPLTGVGWTVNKAGTRWRYRDPGGAVGGIYTTTLQLGDKGRRLRIGVKGHGAYDVTRGDEPLTLQILAIANPMECGQARFAPPNGQRPACRFNNRGSVLQCR